MNNFLTRCGYCGEEIYTRYAATYHNKYKHPGEARNFIKDEQDVSIYYVNRAKKGSSNSFLSNNSSSNCYDYSEEEFDKKGQRHTSPSPKIEENKRLKLSQEELSKQKLKKKSKRNHENSESIQPIVSTVSTQIKQENTGSQAFFNPDYFSSPNQPTAMAFAQLMLSNAAALVSNPTQSISSSPSTPSKASSSSSSSSTSTSPQQQQQQQPTSSPKPTLRF